MVSPVSYGPGFLPAFLVVLAARVALVGGTGWLLILGLMIVSLLVQILPYRAFFPDRTTEPGTTGSASIQKANRGAPRRGPLRPRASAPAG